MVMLSIEPLKKFPTATRSQNVHEVFGTFGQLNATFLRINEIIHVFDFLDEKAKIPSLINNVAAKVIINTIP